MAAAEKKSLVLVLFEDGAIRNALVFDETCKTRKAFESHARKQAEWLAFPVKATCMEQPPRVAADILKSKGITAYCMGKQRDDKPERYFMAFEPVQVGNVGNKKVVNVKYAESMEAMREYGYQMVSGEGYMDNCPF